MARKVFVSGCFDLLHSGHVEFFKEAASYGDLYVALGSDRTVNDLKGRPPVNTETERLFMVQSVSWVKEAFISQGSGILDFVEELKAIRPDIFVVNEEGNTPDKRDLVESLGIEYHVLQREPHPGLTPRSTTALRNVCRIPYRIDVAGGWLDQPFVSKLYPGAVITISLEPTVEFNERSGMASSTRRAAIELWGPRLPIDNYEKLAKILFCYDNPPGTTEISGAQDTIGIVFPGLAKSYYEGEYWPARIDSVQDEATLRFIENALYLVPLGPRESGFSVLSDTNITREGAQALSEATDRCWDAILAHDIRSFGQYFRASLEAQVAMFPHMMTPMVAKLIDRYRDVALGWKLSGAGGGGYLILVADHPIEDGFQVTIRREDY
ncbi:MAG: adenylyltransferase/cytidyltransferase family protein [Anaerolineae bacterium]|nr:adenylyltransferase/cytidyltransferase family protein [Anaerolineae bacterium]